MIATFGFAEQFARPTDREGQLIHAFVARS
jgi:hypothetical protein